MSWHRQFKPMADMIGIVSHKHKLPNKMFLIFVYDLYRMKNCTCFYLANWLISTACSVNFSFWVHLCKQSMKICNKLYYRDKCNVANLPLPTLRFLSNFSLSTVGQNLFCNPWNLNLDGCGYAWQGVRMHIQLLGPILHELSALSIIQKLCNTCMVSSMCMH